MALMMARLSFAAQHTWRSWCSTAMILLCVCALQALPKAVRADTMPLVLAPGAQVLDAWQAVTLLSDTTHRLNVQETLGRLNEFAAPTRRSGALGVRKEAVWLRIPLTTPDSPPPDWILNIDYGALLEIDMYLTQGGQVLQHASMGYLRAPSPASFSSRTPSMALKLAAGQTYDVLIRVRTLGPLILPITLSEAPYRSHLALREQMLQGLLNGLAFFLLVYSLIQWAVQRDRLFAYYALVVLGSAGFSLQFFGIGAQFLWPGNVWVEGHGATIAGFVALVGSFLFLSHALAADAPLSRYMRVMKLGAAVSALLCVAHMLDMVGTRMTTVFMSLLGPLPSIFSIPAALRRLRRRDPIGATLLVAWTVYAVAAVVMMGLVQGWLPANFWTLHGFQFGATLDMLLFLQVMGLRANAMRRQAQDALRERDVMHSLAHSDPLTGLNNRRGLQQALQAAVARCSTRSLVAVYLMDLDGFKPINDSYGHDVGDDLLVAVGQRLQASVRQQTDLVARLGGDEFIIMACHLETPQQAEDLGRVLLRAFDLPFSVRDQQMRVGLTIGYALAPLDSNDPQGLIRLADAAMYAGKQGGKRSIRRNTGTLALAP